MSNVPPDETAEQHENAEDANGNEAGGEHTNFSSLVLSLGSSTLVHLGELEHPDHAGPAQNLALAKQSLEILTMLQEKTRGNLTSDEQTLLEQLLYELRLKYVAARG